MIDDDWTRQLVAKSISSSLDGLVQDRMTGLVEEPDITSRIGQRLEDNFDKQDLHGFHVRVITETIPSHGRGSLEKPTGTDLYFAISVEDQLGRVTTKGILVQAKREDKMHWPDLGEQCRRMRKITRKGSVVWLYDRSGIKVIKATDLLKQSTPVIRSDEFFDAVLACEIGDKRKVPKGVFGDRQALKAMLEDLGAKNAVWLELEEN
jgi:hypothetical protein